MRREIEAALDNQRNIVPLMLAGFDFDTPATASQLTGKLAALKKYNGLPIPKGYFPPAMERLRNNFLNVPVDAVLHPASDSAEQVAKEQKDKATMVLGQALHQPSLSPEERPQQEESVARGQPDESKRAEVQAKPEADAQSKIKEDAEVRHKAQEKRKRDSRPLGQKFFVSFNSADQAKAHWIAWTLKEAGHEVAVHDWEIPAGGSVPLWMNTKLAWADRLIAVISTGLLACALFHQWNGLRKSGTTPTA
jgi:hypothetical protein